MIAHMRLHLALVTLLLTVGLALPSADVIAVARPLIVRAVGDVAIAGTMRDEVLAHDLDPFAELGDTIREADLAFVNLEAVLTDRRPPVGNVATPGIPLLKSPVRTATQLRAAGFDVVSLANNHALDYGPLGLADTLRHVEAAQLRAVGAGSTVERALRETIVTVRGVRIGVLAFTEKSNQHTAGDGYVARQRSAIARIEAVRGRVDVLLVSMHWGEQYEPRPEPAQRRFAHALIDAGADAIIGHHPHVLQTVETYAGKPIIYSLGNFVFGPQPAPRDVSAIAELEITRGRVSALRMIPVILRGTVGSPVVSTGRHGERARERLRPGSVWQERAGLLEMPLGPLVASR